MKGAHTGANIYQTFISILEDYQIDGKIHGVTLDNASNNLSFIEYLDANTRFNSTNHIRCFAHVINLAAQCALDVLKAELKKLREGINKIKSTPQQFEKFEECQNELHLSPILDCVTRWNSTADMIERALKLKEPIIRYITALDC